MKIAIKIIYYSLLSFLLIVQSFMLIVGLIAIFEYPNKVCNELVRNGFSFYIISVIPFFSFGYFFIQELQNKKSNVYGYPKFIYLFNYSILLLSSFLFLFFLFFLLNKINSIGNLDDSIFLFILPNLLIFFVGMLLTIRKIMTIIKD